MSSELRAALDHLAALPVEHSDAEFVPPLDVETYETSTCWFLVDGTLVCINGSDEQIEQELRRINSMGAVIRAARPPVEHVLPRGYARASSHIRL